MYLCSFILYTRFLLFIDIGGCTPFTYLSCSLTHTHTLRFYALSPPQVWCCAWIRRFKGFSWFFFSARNVVLCRWRFKPFNLHIDALPNAELCIKSNKNAFKANSLVYANTLTSIWLNSHISSLSLSLLIYFCCWFFGPISSAHLSLSF